MVDIVIRRYQNGFSVFCGSPDLVNALSQINDTLTQVPMNRQSKFSKFKKPAVKVDEYFIYAKPENRYYYSNSFYKSVVSALSSVVPPRAIGKYTIKELEYYPQPGELVEFDKHKLNLIEKEGTAFAFQNKVIDFAMEADKPHRVFEIQTGRGKTKMALKVGVKFGQRILIITKAAYVPKWIGDVEDNLGIKAGELCVPKTSKQFEDLLQIGLSGRMGAQSKSDKTIKVIILSSSILDNWVRNWLEYGHSIHPTNIVSVLGSGLTIYDESHQLFRKNYWSFLLLNASKFLDLSATLEPDASDVFMKERYLERFPLANRYTGLEYNKYIDGYSIYYGIGDKKLKKRINSMSMYNHTEFELLIAKDEAVLAKYFEMVSSIVDLWYVKLKETGDKAIVFFATKKMCTMYQEHAIKKYPALKVTRNIEGDNYNEFITGDLCVSTPGKSGTAIDIPGLILNIVTVAISKRQMNLQILGRVRDLRNPNKYPKAVFLHCSDVKKHIQYLNRRKVTYEGKVRSFKILNSSFMI